MQGRRAFPASTVPRKPQQQKMRICSIAKGPLKERAFLLAYEMASGNLKHCARVGRDQGGSIKGANVFSFNPRARAGRDSPGRRTTRPDECFNPRARAGRDGRKRQSFWGLESVSIHAPARRATTRCFNPRARAGRDALDFRGVELQPLVSIHAPAWGATRRGEELPFMGHVSIHAPAWGATIDALTGSVTLTGFNPRARVGRDFPGMFRRLSLCGFNPRARVGRDLTW